MIARCSAAFAALLVVTPAAVAAGQSAPPTAPDTVVVASSGLRLKALLWRPAGSGLFPAVLFSHGRSDDARHTGGLAFVEAAQRLGPAFVEHGYAFLYLFRRSEGLSRDQGLFIGDIVRRVEASDGEEAGKHMQFVLLTTDHLDDVVAGLSYLKGLPAIDAQRIAVAGHSFGGQLTLLAAERDSTVRAAVAFAAAAGSWEGSSELRERLLTAVRRTTVPVMLVYASNDHSVAPGQALAGELELVAKPHLLKIYPPVGHTSDDGHAAVCTAIPRWEEDVFRFLDEHLER
ncbi:MAG: alpha/beta hydrolase family protein [Gemmatimonadota bacterium]